MVNRYLVSISSLPVQVKNYKEVTIPKPNLF